MELQLAEIVKHRRLTALESSKNSERVFNKAIVSSPTIDQPNFTQLAGQDIRSLFDLIDDHFFDGQVNQTLVELNYPLRTRLSRRMTSSGGITTMSRPSNSYAAKEFEIAVSSTLLFQSFRNEKTISVTGVRCHNRLEALQRIVEHEMIHVVEMLLWHDSNCAAGRFRGIAGRLFGHRQSSHQLLTPMEVAERDHGIEVGSRVRFRFNGRCFEGFVNRVTRRATVLVPDARGVPYDDGSRYLKYYVPISELSVTR